MIYHCEEYAFFFDFSSLWGFYFRLTGLHLPLTDFSALEMQFSAIKYLESFHFSSIYFGLFPHYSVWQFCLKSFICITLGHASLFPTLK